MEITYDYYRIFYYVATYESFSKAAKVLMSNQPNVTRFMNNLENQLGCKLFVRSNRGVTLTAEGKKLYQHVSIAYQQLHMAETELGNVQNMEEGSVTISASEISLHLLLLPVLGEFHGKYPKIRLQLLNHSTPQAVQAVKDGQVDFAVVTSPMKVTKPLKVTSLMKFQDIIVGDKSFADIRSPKHFKDLLKYPMVSLGSKSTTYEFYSRLFLEQGLIFHPDMEVGTIDQVLLMIVNGLGIGLLPELFVKELLEEGKVCKIPVVEKIPGREICLVGNHNFPPKIAAEMLKKMLISYGKDM